MNPFGVIVGGMTLFVIGLGFPLVIRAERIYGYICWPYMMGFGLVIVAASLFIKNDWLCVIVAVVGATFIWGSTELKEQAVRAEIGWFPYNPNKLKIPFADVIAKWRAPHL